MQLSWNRFWKQRNQILSGALQNAEKNNHHDTPLTLSCSMFIKHVYAYVTSMRNNMVYAIWHKLHKKHRIRYVAYICGTHIDVKKRLIKILFIYFTVHRLLPTDKPAVFTAHWQRVTDSIPGPGELGNIKLVENVLPDSSLVLWLREKRLSSEPVGIEICSDT